MKPLGTAGPAIRRRRCNVRETTRYGRLTPPCDRPVYGAGVCWVHYEDWTRYGDRLRLRADHELPGEAWIDGMGTDCEFCGQAPAVCYATITADGGTIDLCADCLWFRRRSVGDVVRIVPKASDDR